MVELPNHLNSTFYLIKEIMLDIETSEKAIKLDNVYLIYGILKKYCLVDDMTKQAYIEGINEK